MSFFAWLDILRAYIINYVVDQHYLQYTYEYFFEVEFEISLTCYKRLVDLNKEWYTGK